MGESAIPVRMPALAGEVVGASMASMIEMVLGSRLIFADRLDAGALERATRLLLDLEPVLGCWYEPNRAGGTWVRCEGLDERVPFSLLETSHADADAAAFHGAPFEPRGPRLAVLLLRTADHDEVCVRLDHVAGDGWSAKEVTHLLAETYSHVLEDTEYAPPPNMDARPTYDMIWQALSGEQQTAAKDVPPPTPSKWKMRIERGAGDTLHARWLTLPAERVAAVRAYAHDRGATLNEALIAALIRGVSAVDAQAKPSKPGVSISADMRRLAPQQSGLDRLGMLATTQNIVIDHRPDEPFDETLHSVIEAIKPYRACLWGVGSTRASMSPALLRAGFGMLATIGRVMHFTALSDMNVGPFDEHRLAFGSQLPVSAIATGPLLKMPSFPALISGYRDTITIWMGLREKQVSPHVVEGVLAETNTQLSALVG